MANYHIDETDQKILSMLIKNARTPFLEIARECGISGAAVHQRVHKLEEKEIITGSRLQVKPGALGLNICAYISITISHPDKYAEVVAQLKKVPEVTECNFVTGKASMLVKVYCKDNDHLMDLLLNRLQMMSYIQSTETMIILDNAIDRQVWVKDYSQATYEPIKKKK